MWPPTEQFYDVPEEADVVVAEFRSRFFDTELFFDPYAKGKFAGYLFSAHQEQPSTISPALARQTIEEAQLFIEATYRCYDRISSPVAATFFSSVAAT